MSDRRTLQREARDMLLALGIAAWVTGLTAVGSGFSTSDLTQRIVVAAPRAAAPKESQPVRSRRTLPVLPHISSLRGNHSGHVRWPPSCRSEEDTRSLEYNSWSTRFQSSHHRSPGERRGAAARFQCFSERMEGALGPPAARSSRALPRPLPFGDVSALATNHLGRQLSNARRGQSRNLHLLVDCHGGAPGGTLTPTCVARLPRTSLGFLSGLPFNVCSTALEVDAPKLPSPARPHPAPQRLIFSNRFGEDGTPPSP